MAEERPRLRVDVPENLETIYSNFALVRNSQSEIIIDLCQLVPDTNRVALQARVVMTLPNAKLLSRAFANHLAKYEAECGEIKTPDEDLAGQLFRSKP